LQEVIGVVRTASFSEMLHSVLLSRPHEYAGISRGNLALIENRFAAADGALDSAAEARSNVRAQAMTLHKIFGMEVKRLGNIHYRKIGIGSGNQAAFVGDSEPGRRMAREQLTDSLERKAARMIAAIEQDR
jgi:hypothetical protein